MERPEDFASAVRPDEVFGAVFERDDETAYFYLLDLTRPEGKQIVGALNVATHVASRGGVDVRWSSMGEAVGLFASEVLVAIYPDMSTSIGRTAVTTDQGLFV